MASSRSLPASPCWAFGNGFGGIDLGFLVAEWLTAEGLPTLASVCHVGGHRSGVAAQMEQVVWPRGDTQPRCILFCDDSITSGGTFRRFRQLCRQRYPRAEVQAFLLSYDLNPQWTQRPDASERFRVASAATARAPWSPAPHPKACSGCDNEAPIAAMKRSSDEKLRWLGETQAEVVTALNRRERRFFSDGQATETGD
jgi:hypothetical protein